MRLPLVVSISLMLAAAGVSAQAPPGTAGETGVVGELVKLNGTLRELADTLAKQAEQTSLDLLMKRTQMAQALVERTETQLQRASSERATVDDEASRLSLHRKQLEVVPAAEREAAMAELELVAKRLADRLRSLDAEIIELQNRITARQEELRAWQVVLDRRLAGQ